MNLRSQRSSCQGLRLTPRGHLDRHISVITDHRPYRVSGSLSPAFQHGYPGSRLGKNAYDLWWKMCHWDRYFSSSSVFPCRYHSTVALHTRISPGDEQWWLQFRDMVSPLRHGHEQQHISRKSRIICVLSVTALRTISRLKSVV
jgi:hypothetical protein